MFIGSSAFLSQCWSITCTPLRALLLSGLVFVDRREKTSIGQTSSIYFYIQPCDIPVVFLLYDPPFWSGAFFIAIFSVSHGVWNGAVSISKCLVGSLNAS
ncbi:hypothetical protein BDP27DRAFT_477632 [Rhodocollybia butyracea]|uniref:Secreted protein n=1 Tax=Rhodocollybia butyracea TaxID=206335 RepID=A0A9P5QA99_9AGAR|nr:hypothetical protein BDP27DRAFT_477632 [Rhodocollybia butyracea]